MNLRALITAMIVMAVLIVLGIITLIGGIIHKMSASSMAEAITLAEPPGSRIVSIAGQGPDRLAVHLQGGGADRVDIVDLRNGRVLSRLVLAQ